MILALSLPPTRQGSDFDFFASLNLSSLGLSGCRFGVVGSSGLLVHARVCIVHVRGSGFLMQGGAGNLQNPPREVPRIAWLKSQLEMGSAKETEALPFLKQEIVPEDAHQPTTCLLCSQEENSCLQNTSCERGDFTMRNCCVNELSTIGSSPKIAMVDNPNQNEKSQAVDSKSSIDLPATPEIPVLENIGTPSEEKGETAAAQVSKQDLNLKEIPGGSVSTCSSLERRASPVAGEVCQHLPSEPGLKAFHLDSSLAPTSLKHVAFLEPVKTKVEEECIQTETVCSETTPGLPECLQNTGKEQPYASEEDNSHISSDICKAVEHGNDGSRVLPASETTKQSILEHSEAETTSGLSGKPFTARSPLGHTEETKFPVAESHSFKGSRGEPDVLVTSISYEVKHQGKSSESVSTPGEVMEEKRGVRETTPSNCGGQNQAHEQKLEMISIATREEPTTDGEKRSVEFSTQTCVFEVTPPQHDAGTQMENRVSLVSVAVSPINPPSGSTAFTFHSRDLGTSSLKSPGPEEKPTKRDVEMQVFIPVETRSVATGPMTPVTKSPQSSYPEVHIKGAQEETSEPIREVSWDEKGMTWEVYGASMEVEVLGMAIQKHLEKQIEEHGRQMVMTPQSTRSGSVRAPPHKSEIKRQPNMFRSLLQNVRRPRCCSRGGPAVE